MIELINLTKKFGDTLAVDHVSVTVKDANVFGLIGTNGAGKSTAMRMIAGVLRPDEGQILIDGMSVYDNVEVLKQIFFVSDEPYFFPNACARDMKNYYCKVYESFDTEAFDHYLEVFGLDMTRKIANYSKGMKKQLAFLLGLCSKTKYLLCDETFDGLDPVMRQSVKSLVAKEVEERGLTPVFSSHNLRELEDICDHVGLLHKGGVLLSKDLEDMKCNISKVQCVFKNPEDADAIMQDIEVLTTEKRGSLYTMTVRLSRELAKERFARLEPVFYEVLPLSLEEIFISETEVAGYEIKKLILG